jgi:hypothetical protein
MSPSTMKRQYKGEPAIDPVTGASTIYFPDGGLYTKSGVFACRNRDDDVMMSPSTMKRQYKGEPAIDPVTGASTIYFPETEYYKRVAFRYRPYSRLRHGFCMRHQGIWWASLPFMPSITSGSPSCRLCTFFCLCNTKSPPS